MGMFDELRCALPLPVGQDWVYQTKDTNEQGMKMHAITEKGRLILHDYETEMTPEDELPHKDAPAGSFLRLCGMMRKKAGSESDVDLNFDGDLHFYSGEADYRATFRAGSCREICQYSGASGWVAVWGSGK
jgi:hypothetical protein